MTVNPNYCSGIITNNSIEEKIEKSNASKPIGFGQNSEASKPKELASKEAVQGTRAMVMAQILVGSDLKPNTTQKEYINRLIKQGKIPNKHFFIEKDDCGYACHVIEVNSNGEKIKEVRFFDGGNIGCSFYNPKTQKRYKSLETLDGKLHISYNDVITGEPLCDELYRPDGSLERNAFYKKTPKGETSINGEYQIYGIEGTP